MPYSKRSLLAVIAVSAVAALSACKDKEGEGADASAGPGPNAEAEAEVAQACECDPAIDDDCGPMVCATAFAVCDRGCVNHSVSEEEDLQCALEALRDRTPGTVAWGLNEYEIPTMDVAVVRIFADGSAALFRRTSHVCQPKGYNSTGPDNIVMLKDAAYFEGCLAEADPFARFKCMQEPVLSELSECAPYVAQCE